MKETITKNKFERILDQFTIEDLPTGKTLVTLKRKKDSVWYSYTTGEGSIIDAIVGILKFIKEEKDGSKRTRDRKDTQEQRHST